MLLYMFVGSCNVPTPYFASANGEGISILKFDTGTGEASPVANYGGIDNPTYLSTTRDGRRIYANSELFGRAQGLVTALAFLPDRGEIAHLDMVASRGSITSHNSISNDGRYLLVTNYALGSEGPDKSVAVFPISGSDGIEPACASAAHEGSGADPTRQERPHAHFVRQMPDGRVVVADLGIDQLLFYRLSEDGALALEATCDLPEGTGPRHLTWTKDGSRKFVVGELNNTVASLCTRSGQSPELVDVASTIPGDAATGNHCSGIQISPDDRFLYVGNRGQDTITVFAIDQDGHLTLQQSESCGGATPRDLALTPCGQWLFAANQDSDHIAVFIRDMRTGKLTAGPRVIEIGTPMCVKFAVCPA